MGEPIKSLKDLKKEIEMNERRQETAQRSKASPTFSTVDKWPCLEALVKEYGLKETAKMIGLSPNGLAGQLGSDRGVNLYYERAALSYIQAKELNRRQDNTTKSVFTIVANHDDAVKIAHALELLHVDFDRREV